MHPEVEALAFLIGSWVGEGRGHYPTIEDFRYREELRFAHIGKPYLSYVQRTWTIDDDRPMHAESGYLRPLGGGDLEYVLSHPTGLAEVGGGRVVGQHIRLHARVARTASALPVDDVERDIQVEDGVLRYELRMSMPEVPITRHLVASLTRVEED